MHAGGWLWRYLQQPTFSVLDEAQEISALSSMGTCEVSFVSSPLQRVPAVPLSVALSGACAFEAHAEPGTSWLLAWNPVKQRPVWRVPIPGMGGARIAATAGNLVFQGRCDGKLRDFPVWDHPNFLT